MTHSLIWILLFVFSAFTGVDCVRFSRFDIAISFSNISTKLSTSVFNLSVANYCVGGLPVSNGDFNYTRVYHGDLVRLIWRSMQNENRILSSNCLLYPYTRSHRSPWIAVIIEDKTIQPGCSLSALFNQSTSFTNASAVLFLRAAQTAFNQPATEPSFTFDSSSSHTPFVRHRLERRQRNQESGLGSFTPSPLLISLPLDMFPDLPGQLAVASNSNQVAVTGDIELFAEPLSNSNIATADVSSNAVTDLSSCFLLLLIVCVLFLLLGILLVPARLGVCFWQRLCCIPISRSAKSHRSRRLTAATKKALKQLPVKCLNQVDTLISEGFDQCAICIEIFKSHDLIRSLPCRHMYHRACIDPWLLKHRSCPLCKQNILIACGLSFTEDDMESCSASASEVDSAFSLSASTSPSISSTSPIDDIICLPLFNILNCRHLRHRRRRRRQYHGPHPYRDFEHLRHPGSLDEVSAPSGGRQVLGSASENSSSSITARSVPPDLYFHGTPGISSEKGARFVVEEYDEEDSSFAARGSQRRGRCFLMPRRYGWRTGNLMNSCYGCCGGARCGMGKERAIGDTPPPPPLPLSPSSGGAAAFFPPPVVHPSTMLLYHLPQSLPFSQVSKVSKAALPSYEQATATMPQAALVVIPGLPPCPHQAPLATWNLHFTTEAHQQTSDGIFDSHLPNQSGAKTNVVYAVLSNSAARMSVNSGLPTRGRLLTHQLSSSSNLAGKLPISVDVNLPMGLPSAADVETFLEGGPRQCLLSSSSPPLITRPRGESPPPAYSLTALNTGEKPPVTSLHPLRQAVRFLAARFLSPPPKKQINQQHHYQYHQQRQSRHRHHAFLGGLKASNYSHQQHCDSKTHLKAWTPRRLHEASYSSIMARHHRHYHRRIDRECQRVGRVLAKTLELSHEGMILSAGSLGAASAIRSKMPSIVAAARGTVSPPPIKQTSPKSIPSHSTSELSSEGTHYAPLRHTRVRSVRVTVEPQIQYHTERDAASCEALHNPTLHTLTCSKISLPRATTLPFSLKSISMEGVDVDEIKIDEDGISAAALCHCRSSAGSAPTLCYSPSFTINSCKPVTDIKNTTVLHSFPSSTSL